MAWKPLVLVVDDDPGVRKAIQVVLELSLDVRVVTAETGLEALHVAAEKNPSLVLVNTALSGLTGSAIIRLLKEDPETEHIPVVAIGPEVLADQARDAGCDDSIQHPVKLLVDTVKRHLSAKKW